MKLEIGDKIIPPVYKNQYKVVVTFMIGDADGYEENVGFIDEDDADLERFVEFIVNCRDAYPRGMGGSDDYTHVKDYDLFHGAYVDWSYEPYSGNTNSVDGIQVTYFDSSGDEFEVKIKK